MRSLAAGDPQALGSLYDRFAEPVYAVAVRICGDADRSERITEQVFTDFWQRREHYRTATRTPLAELLRRCREIALGPGHGAPDDLAAPGAEASADWGGLSGVGPDALCAAVRDVLQTFPPEARAAIELAYFDGLPVTRIAERTRMTPAQVLEHLRRGLDAIKPLLGSAPARGPAS